MAKDYSLVQNPIGYYEVTPKPTLNELQDHYAEKYYQDSHGSYEKTYSDAELKFFEVESELCSRTINRYADSTRKNLIDLGCGEGFFAVHFMNSGWRVRCVDFSSEGISNHNPELLPNFTQSELLSYLESENSEMDTFGLVNLDNVLEHVLDPVAFLRLLGKVINSETIVRIEVPNDFSRFQSLLIKLGCTEETWVSPPEHLSYFNRDSLLNLFEATGFDLISLQADFPIEQFLLNEHSNYWKDRSLGKGAHMARVYCTNYMAEVNPERLIDYREAAADLEFGRLLTAYVKRSVTQPA